MHGVNRGRWWMWGYALALVASWAYQGAVALRHDAGTSGHVADATPTHSGGVETVHPYEGALAPVPVRIAWTVWRGPAGGDRTPVILIHGAPGGKDDWVKLAPMLATRRDVYAIDLPGFGESSLRVPDHSARANASALRAWMDARGIARAHVVGWSNGGGVALHIAHDAPARVASMTLLASIGEQRFEGTGSHFIEHARYDLGMLLLGPCVDMIPHFGVLGARDARTAWLRSFMQGDQRPFTRMMREIGDAGSPPTLILHGRSDFLVPVRTAISTHEQMRGSRLVLIDANHIIPFMQAEVAARVLTPFFDATDDASGQGLRTAIANGGPTWLEPGSTTELDPRARSPIQRAVEPAREVVRGASPWTQIGVIAILAVFAPALAAACATMLVLGLDIDYLTAILGVFAGLCMRDLIAMMWATRVLRNKAHARVPTWIERRLRLVPGSAQDWQRRLERAPFGEAWTACLMRDVRESSPPAAARADATESARVWFALGRLVGSAMVAVVSVMGGVVIGGIVVLVLSDPAHAAFAREDLDIALLWAPMLAMLLLCARGLPLVFSRRGRTRAYVFVRRCFHHEFWQSFWFYVPFWPVYAYLMVKHRGLLVWTCCNPGIGSGGGIIGECKTECFERFGVPNLAASSSSETGQRFDAQGVGIWPYATIPAGPAASVRAAMALELITSQAQLGGFPVVLKPDSGFRGLGLKLARNAEQLIRYFDDVPAAVLIQRFHPGPLECSVLWVRSLKRAANDGRIGTIYSITQKQFQSLEGDGVRTLERLIDRDSRARLQRDTFRVRFAHQLSRVLAKGERIALNVAGNHCQGTIFRDAEHLRSPALEHAIDRFCSTYENGGIDLVRLDIRYETAEQLREGRALAIVDVNGTMGESVNMYDPEHAYPWALRVLSGHWANMFAIGAWRRAQGVKPLSLVELIRLRGYYDERHGSSVSD